MFLINATLHQNTPLGVTVSGLLAVRRVHTGHIKPPILPDVMTPESALTCRGNGDVLLKLAAAIYRKMDLASSHDVVQERVDSVELMGDKRDTQRGQGLLVVTLAVFQHSHHSPSSTNVMLDGNHM